MIRLHLIQASYFLAAALFIFSLRWMSHPKTARRGVFAGVAGMTLAIVGTLIDPHVHYFTWIAVAFVIGTIIGDQFQVCLSRSSKAPDACAALATSATGGVASSREPR